MTAQSEAMMNLLKELALLKELDGASDRATKPEESQAREIRRQEITNQIKALGETAS
jgi:hypothetical protein